MADSRYKVQEFVAHSTRVNCLCFGPKSNQVLATGGEDCKVNIWRVGDTANIWTLGQNKSPIDCLCFDSEELCVVSGTTNGSLKVFDLNVGKLARNLGGHPVGVTSVQYHPYGEFIVSGSVDCTMKVWDVRAKCCIQTYNGHTKEITCVRFSPDGKWVASASKDGQMQFWDLVAGKLVNSIKLQPVYVRTFEFSPADFTVAAATSMRTVRFWDLETMESIGTTTSESNPVQAIAYSSLGTELYTAAKDNLRSWDLEPSVSLRSTIETGWEKIDDMRVSNNSQLIAGSCFSNFVSIWSVDLQEDNVQRNGRDEGNTERGSQKDGVSSSNSVAGSAKYNNNYNQAKESSPAVPPRSGVCSGAAGAGGGGVGTGQSNQQQLNDVRRQLSQLSSDLGLAEPRSSNGGAQEKGQYGADGSSVAGTNQSSRVSSQRYAAEAKTPGTVAEYDDVGDKAVGNNGRLQRPSGPSAAADAKGTPLSQDEAVPSVVWENGHSQSQEMATSMGESFWNRFKQSQQRQQQLQDLPQGSKAEPNTVDDAEQGDDDWYDEDSDFAADDNDHNADADDLAYDVQRRLDVKQEQVEVPDEELEDMLPPPSYESDSRSALSGGVSGKSAPGSASAASAAPASAARRPEDRFSNPVTAPRAAGVPIVRSSPLAIGDSPVSEDPRSAANNARKAPIPSFPRAAGPQRVPTPAESKLELQPPSGGSNKSNVRDATPESDPTRAMAVVGLRHVRSPSGSNAAGGAGAGSGSGAGTPASAVGGYGGRGSGAAGGDGESRNTTELLEHLLSDSVPTRTALAQRLQSLKLMRLLWERGEVSDCIDHLTVLADALAHHPANLTTLSDFFEAVELRGNGLNLDSCVRLLPVLESVVSAPAAASSEHAMFAAFKSLTSLVDGFGDLIRNTRATIIVAGGVDLSREARLQKCNTCYDIFRRLLGRVEQVRRQFRASRTTVEVMDVFVDQCARYL